MNRLIVAAILAACVIFFMEILSQEINDVNETGRSDTGSDIGNCDTECQCHPPPNLGNVRHYLIGFGSLMQKASKSRTYPSTGESVPIVVKGFERKWNTRGILRGAGITYLGVEPNVDASFNGVVFELSQTQNTSQSLKNFDAREAYYCRQRVPTQDIQFLANNMDKNGDPIVCPNGVFWIYVTKPAFVAKPDDNYPIIKAYMDIFLSGCTEIGEKFTLPHFVQQCVETTSDWSKDSKEWTNNRDLKKKRVTRG